MSDTGPSGVSQTIFRAAFRLLLAVIMIVIAIELIRSYWVPLSIALLVLVCLAVGIWWWRARNIY